MNKPTVSTVLWVAVSCLLSVPVFGGEAKPSPNSVAEVKVGPTRVDWVPAVDAERWILTVSGPGDFFLRRQFEGDKAPFLSLFDTEGDRLPDGSYAWELQGVQERETGTPEPPSRPRETGKTFNAPRASELEISGRLSIQDGSFAATPPNGSAGNPESPLHNVTAKFYSEGPFANKGNGCIGDQCNSMSDADFSALKLRSTFPNLLFDDIDVPCEGTCTDPPAHDWALLANPSNPSNGAQFSISDFESHSLPFTVVAGAPTDSLLIASNGNVGIGTASPATQLHVRGTDTGFRNKVLIENANTGTPTARELLEIRNNGTAVFILKDTSNSQRWSIGSHASSLIFDNQANAGIEGSLSPTGTLTVAGDLGIGTTTPTQELTVKSRSNDGNVVEIQNSSASNTTIFRIFETISGDGLFSVFTNTGAEVVRITSVNNGRIAVGCNFPAHTLDLGNTSGSACSTATSRSYIDAGSTTFTASSSRSIKENLKPVEVDDLLDRISAAKVYNYDFINGPKDKIGLMAEDFHTIFGRGSDKVINGQEVEMALWLAVQELTAQNRELRAQNQEISKRMAELEGQIRAEREGKP